MKRNLLLLFCLFSLAFSGFGQEDERQEAAVKRPREKFYPGARIGLGYQKALFTEAGFSLHQSGGGIMRSYSNCFFTGLEFIPAFLLEKPASLISYKLGFETSSGLYGGGLELKYQISGKNKSWVITPKAGLSVFGSVNLFYGYNFYLGPNELPVVGKHQFSLAVNLNRHW